MTEILFFLQWQPDCKRFAWVPWAYLSELNDRYRSMLLKDSEPLLMLIRSL